MNGYLCDFSNISSKQRYQCKFFYYVDLKLHENLTPLQTLVLTIRLLANISTPESLQINEMMQNYVEILIAYLSMNLNTEKTSFCSSEILGFLDPTGKIYASKTGEKLKIKVRLNRYREDSKLVPTRKRPKVDASIFLLFFRRVRATNMSQRRVENTRVHFWTFSPVSVNISIFLESALNCTYLR